LGRALSPGIHYCLGYQNGDRAVPFIPDPRHVLHDNLDDAVRARDDYRSQTRLDLHVFRVDVSEVE